MLAKLPISTIAVKERILIIKKYGYSRGFYYENFGTGTDKSKVILALLTHHYISNGLNFEVVYE